jgi:gliding motility-associated protein GldM
LNTDGEYYAANGESLTWEMKNFNHIIIPAAISIINEIVGEVQTIEYDAISELYKNIGASDFKFNTLEAKVFPKTTYVLKGQDFEADVFIVASDDTKEFNAKYAKGVKDFSRANANAINEVSSTQGVIKIKVPANAEGEQSIAGVVEMKNPLTGEVEPYPFNTSYTVAPPSANVTPTKMNVMYRGLENPIAISAPGFTANQINVDVTNGELIKGNNGEYFVKPGNEGNITTVVVSTMIDGKRMILDNCDFRLKRTPDPVPVLNGKTNDKFTKEEILAAGGFVLTMPDFDFEGYHSQILSYDVSTIVGGYLKPIKGIKGRKFNKDVEDLVKSARRGQRINIENIRVKSPDGEERVLNTPIVIELKN